jgi:hypothetical protein
MGELCDKGWISDLACSVVLTFHLKACNRGLQGKDRLITPMFGSIKAFKAELPLWEK